MNKIKRIQAFFSKNEIKIYFLCLSIFFLPLHMGLNNLFLGLFVFAYFIEGDWTIKIKNIKDNYASLIPITVFFIIYAIGFFYSEFTFNALKQVERSVPFLILPLTILSQPLLYEKRFNSFFYSLVFGCLLAAIICWCVLSYNLISNGEIYKIFTWEYSKLNLVKPLNQHAPYLSMFLFTSIGFLVIQQKKVKRKLLKHIIVIILVLLILFNFHLLSRTAILYFLIAAIIFLVINKQYKTLLILLSTVVIFLSVLLNSQADKSEYFKRLFIDQVGINGIENIDGRFERWKYSYQLFTENPIFGKGTGDVDALRTVKFLENQDIIGFKNKYNAHNQFFEFLSGQGIVGSILYLLSFVYLIRSSYLNKQYFYFYVLTGIFFCCFTESMFRVSWGVVFFSLVASLSLVKTCKSKISTSIIK